MYEAEADKIAALVYLLSQKTNEVGDICSGVTEDIRQKLENGELIKGTARPTGLELIYEAASALYEYTSSGNLDETSDINTEVYYLKDILETMVPGNSPEEKAIRILSRLTDEERTAVVKQFEPELEQGGN